VRADSTLTEEPGRAHPTGARPTGGGTSSVACSMLYSLRSRRFVSISTLDAGSRLENGREKLRRHEERRCGFCRHSGGL